VSGALADNEAVLEAGSDRTPAVVRFRAAYEMLATGDEARDTQRYSEAIRLYREALGAYLDLAAEYPGWQPGVTRFRISYCDSQLEALLKRIEKGALSAGPEEAGMPGEDPVLAAVPVEATEPGERTVLDEITSDASLLIRKGETEDARTLLLKALEVEPDDMRIRLLIAILHCRAAEFDRAMHVMEQLVREHPSDAVARVVLGSAYFGLGRLKAAAEEMREAIRLNPALPEAHYDLAQIMLVIRPPNKEAAALHYRRALELGSERDETIEKLLE